MSELGSSFSSVVGPPYSELHFSPSHVDPPHIEKYGSAAFSICFPSWVRHLFHSITSRMFELIPVRFPSLLGPPHSELHYSHMWEMWVHHILTFFLRWVRYLNSSTSQLSELTPVPIWATLYLYHSLLLYNLVSLGLPHHRRFAFGEFWQVAYDCKSPLFYLTVGSRHISFVTLWLNVFVSFSSLPGYAVMLKYLKNAC